MSAPHGTLSAMTDDHPGAEAGPFAARVAQLAADADDLGDRIDVLARQANRLLLRLCALVLLRALALFLALWVLAGLLLRVTARG